VVVAPGEIWNYSGGCTAILGALLHKCTGKPIDEFAQEALFEPHGIADAE
jgi:CubicO group peptidase (beta-lactamase class C family)